LALAPASGAAAKVEITKIVFDPKGKDTGTNQHLNRERVIIDNMGSRTKNLKGWKLYDKGRDYVYRFRTRLRLEPGDRIILHTGRGENLYGSCSAGCPVTIVLFWNLKNYVWDNLGDVATLKRPSGTVADRCRYGPSAQSPKRC
jgi:hypothetical protein